MDATDHAAAQAPRPRRRWLGGALLALLVALAASAWWLLGTGAGLRFALARASGFTDGALSVQQARGRVIGPLDLAGVRYADGKGLDVRVGSMHLDLRLWPLLAGRVHVLALQADDVHVALPPASEDTQARGGGFSLTAPVDLLLDRGQVGKVEIVQGGKPLFVSDSLALAGSWTADGIVLERLALRAPDGHADLDGRLVLGTRNQGAGGINFDWKLGGTEYAGKLTARSDGRHGHFELALKVPMVASLQLSLTQQAPYPWTARLLAPKFDPKPLLGDSALTALGADLQGSGDRHGGTLQGRLDLNDYPLLLQPLRAHFSDGFGTLHLDELALGSPQVQGQVQASGTVQLDARPVSGDLAIRWKDLLLPPELVGQALASQGSLQARGSAAQFHAEGDVNVGPPGKPAKLTLDLDGTQRTITLHTLALQQPRGGLQAQGILTLQPVLGWQLEATAHRLDPGQLFAGWSGALDADIATHGTLPQGQPDASLEIRKLSGRLRNLTLRGSGQLHLAPSQVLDGKLELTSGGSTVSLIGKPGQRNDIDLKLAIASLGDWLPGASGHLDGHFNVRGLPPKLSVDGELRGRALAYQANAIDSLQLDAHVPDISQPAGKLDLAATGVHAGGLAFQHIRLDGGGTEARHSLRLEARGTQLSADLALEGGRQGAAWHGSLSALELEPQGLPRWRLEQPVQLAYAGGALSLSELCLSAGEPLVCVAANRDQAGNLDASYRLQAMPLALLLNASGNADLPIRADGSLEGSGQIRRTAAGALSGTASITSRRGTITYVDRADHPLLGWRDLAVNAELGPQQQLLSAHASLDDGGRLNGQVSVSGTQRVLAGQVALHLDSLAPLELLTAELANVKGNLDGNFHFAGTLNQPDITGQARVEGFAAEVPSAGLKLSQGKLVVATSDARHFRVDGSVQSGKGVLTVAGSAGLGVGAQTAITLKGSAFTAADIPAAKVVISPDLVIRQDAKGVDLSGTVALDSADVDLGKLPGAGSVKASPDVVVVDEKQQEQTAGALPISAHVKVELGPRTHLIGMGLDGRLSGVLTVDERPGRDTIGQGQIAVDGTYKAYGQNLHIQRGQLLFASTPIDNPGLNIRAVRKLNPNATIDEGQEVGLLISGTAQRPILTVFSNPVREQSDALSYLVTGKPLSQVKGGEGNMVGAAAQALGSAAGDLLAKSVGSKLGVDEIGVSSNEALGGNSAFTVGKFLSPRLYLSYGVGLFEPGQVISLRYRLSHRWNFEAQQATEFSRASFNYRIEK
jgi:translocation and assembly module TamB